MRLVGVAIAIATLALLASGCGSGDSPDFTVTTSGAVEGYALSSSSAPGGVVFGTHASPPVGATPLAGAPVSIPGTSETSTTEASGHFLLGGVPAGLRKLRVVPAIGAAQETPLTVIGGATVNVGVPPITRQSALDRVKSDASVAGALADAFVMAPQQPLPAGTRVTPALSIIDGHEESAPVHRVETAQWLVYVDLVGNARFEHSVRYYFVDAETGAMTHVDATSWPAINGLNYYGSRDTNVTSPDLVVKPAGAPTIPALAVEATPALPTAEPTRDHVPGCAGGQTYALLVQGDSASEFTADHTHIKTMFGKGGIPATGAGTVTEIKPGTVSPREQVLKALDDIAAKAQPCDTVFVFINGHGDTDGFVKLDSSDTHINQFDGSQIKYQQIEGGDIGPPLRKSKACHIIVIVEACFSGRWLIPLKANFEPNLDKHPGRKVILLTGADQTKESAGYDWRNIFTPTGSAYINALVKFFHFNVDNSFPIGSGADVSLGQAHLDAQNQTAHSSDATEKAQNPPPAYITVYPGTCGGTGTGTQPAVDLTHDFASGTTSFPAGTKIALTRITGGHVVKGPECTTGGVQVDHLHADDAGAGIMIDGKGPYRESETDRNGCGFGKIVQIPK